jgi:threonine synthase
LMKYISTSGKSTSVSFKEAVIKGLAPDNGLYYPENIPRLPDSFFQNIRDLSLKEIGFKVIHPFTAEDLSVENLERIISETLDFPIPLVPVTSDTFALELFHGPTMAFKDVGARFLARCLSVFHSSHQPLTVLVATSGDTGSAVGKGFLQVPGIEVKILYPKGKVSKLQEQQLTTLGHNIEAFEVDGNFDDCQRLVKTAFQDTDLNEALTLTSANSINVARWLPQSIYYFWALAQLPHPENVVVSVPSGNYGNLAGGLLAKAMGLDIAFFIAASNANDVVPEYLKSGNFSPRPSVSTISNAMDVGNPSNFPRMLEIYGAIYENISKDVFGISCSDAATKNILRKLYQETGYLADPHGAVGYYGWEQIRNEFPEYTGIFLETAHPAKFHDMMQEVIGENIPIPDRLRDALDKTKQCTPLSSNFSDLKKSLLGS